MRAHGADPLSWDEDAAAMAQKRADYLLSIHYKKGMGSPHGDLKDASGRKLGQNIYSWWGNVAGVDVTTAVGQWAEEESLYDCNKPGFTKETGHFTQLVWKETASVGIAVARDSRGVYVVADFYPAGNMGVTNDPEATVERYRDNVQASRCG